MGQFIKKPCTKWAEFKKKPALNGLSLLKKKPLLNGQFI